MFYNPAIGYPVTAALVPEQLIGDDGWIQPEPMQGHVHDALARSVGNVLQTGRQSFSVRSWVDRDAADRRVTISAGQWTTGFVRTPASVIEGLLECGLDAAALPNFKRRSLQVRYWTERRSGVARPGRLHMQIKARVRARAQGRARVVKVPAHIECLVQDFVGELG